MIKYTNKLIYTRIIIIALFNCVAMNAFAFSSEDQIAAACAQPLRKYIQGAQLTADDNAALSACYQHYQTYCANPALSSIPECSEKLQLWQTHQNTTQPAVTPAATPVTTGTQSSAAATTTPTVQPKSSTASAPEKVPEKKDIFYNTNDANLPANNAAPATPTTTPAQPTQEATPAPAPAQPPAKQEINWF